MNSVIGYAEKLKAHPELPDGFTYAWLEGEMAAKLAHLKDVPDWKDKEKWHSGRIFGEKGEYRWQRTSQTGFHGVYILDKGELPQEFGGRLEIEKCGNDSSLILWGEWINPEKDSTGNPDSGPRFFVQGIPGILTYPVEPDQAKQDSKLPCLAVQRYKHHTKTEEQFKGEFIRCVSVTMKAKKEGNYGAD